MNYYVILIIRLALFQNGDLCISILHPPVDDPQSGEMPCERWNPTQNVRYVIQLLVKKQLGIIYKYFWS
jgi:ubiquitin-protein ligase